MLFRFFQLPGASFLFAGLHLADYFGSAAVTSISIDINGQASWLTTRKVEAGIGAEPNVSALHFKAFCKLRTAVVYVTILTTSLMVAP